MFPASTSSSLGTLGSYRAGGHAYSAWQNQDGSAIGIPTENGANGASHDDGYGGGRSPRDAPPRRSSRSRSPSRRDEGRGRGDDGQNNPGNNLHVSGLSSKIDSRELEAAFAKIGRVKKASVMYDPHSRESRGFGFVTMESAEEADAAITALNGTDFQGRTLSIEKARRGRARTPTPGRYYGPPKRGGGSEQSGFYDPRPYDSRYARDRGGDYGGRGGDYGGRGGDYGGRGDYPPPRRGGYDDRDDYRRDRRGGGYDDRAPPPPRDYGRDDRRGGGDYDRERRY
ncbi:RNA-binding domain-containing protein [Peniophora sp. CONT]|nr:RNA-binding domain-containing protein [Peniophora sp. CONT]